VASALATTKFSSYTDIKNYFLKKPLICTREVKAAAEVLRAVNHNLRREILSLLDNRGKLTVTDIWTTLKIEQSVCSSQLSILRSAKVVAVERSAKFKYYYVDHARLREINDFSKALTNP
jgi:DNA-binding transcriptional ArsR family regulator